MAVVTLYDFLSDQIADYTATELSVDPQQAMVISGEKEVEIHRGRGRSEERIILSDESKFWVKLQWNALSEADHSTLFDFYNDPDKGCGQGQTFYWNPPDQYDAHAYTVRFDSRWESFLQNFQNYGIASLVLAVVGRKAE